VKSGLRDGVIRVLASEQLSERFLVMAASKLNGMEAVAGDFSGIVVGEVVACGQPLMADLSCVLPKINCGEDEVYLICVLVPPLSTRFKKCGSLKIRCGIAWWNFLKSEGKLRGQRQKCNVVVAFLKLR